MNQGGPPLLGGRVPHAAGPRAGGRRDRGRRSGAQVVDARPAAAHVAGHLAGSLSIPLDESFGTWLGWVMDLDRPVVARRRRTPADIDDLMRQAIRIGRDEIVGVLVGVEAWRGVRPAARGGRPDLDRGAGSRASTTGDRPTGPLVIDVRQASEYEAGHVPGRGTSTPARCRTGSPSCPATGPSPRCAPPGSGPRSPRRSCGRPGSIGRAGSMLASPRGRRPATASRPGSRASDAAGLTGPRWYVRTVRAPDHGPTVLRGHGDATIGA